jgi:predicted outer membrane repeat protein
MAGFGKTAVVKQFCKEHRINLFECDAKSLDLATVGGIPYPVKDASGKWTQRPIASSYWDALFEDNTAHNGAVINSKGLVTMDASNFTNNSAHNGGVIYADSGSITVNNSLFSENYANAQGGVIYNRGQLKVFDSIFSLNYGSQGGAIFNGKYANVDNSTFTENKAGYNGAAIYSENEVNV